MGGGELRLWSWLRTDRYTKAELRSRSGRQTAEELQQWVFHHGAGLTLSLSMASSPPGVDMMRSWMLVTDWRPGWLHSEPDDGEAVREPIGAVEKLPGRWFSEATKYLFLLFWMSLRSEPTAGEKKGQGGRWERTRRWRRKPGRGETRHMEWKNKHKKKKWGLSREDRKRWWREKTKGRGDQCKTTLYWVKTNTQHHRQLWRAAVSSLTLFLEKILKVPAGSLLGCVQRECFWWKPESKSRAMKFTLPLPYMYNYEWMWVCFVTSENCEREDCRQQMNIRADGLGDGWK